MHELYLTFLRLCLPAVAATATGTGTGIATATATRHAATASASQQRCPGAPLPPRDVCAESAALLRLTFDLLPSQPRSPLPSDRRGHPGPRRSPCEMRLSPAAILAAVLSPFEKPQSISTRILRP